MPTMIRSFALRIALAWWRKNRPAAPSLLATEIKAAVGALREAPEIGIGCPGPGVPGLRKVLLPRTTIVAVCSGRL